MINKKGFSLIEVIIILFILSSLFVVMHYVFQNSIANLNSSKARVVAVELANAQMEILRNLAFRDLGTTTGSPSGTILPTKQITRSNVNFTITTSIYYVDDPFDGCAGEVLGEPNKSKCADGTIVDHIRDIPANNNNPADYKKADVEVVWDRYYANQPVKISTIITQKGLEGDTTKGFLLVKVFDASGMPVSGATVNITNNTVIPNVNITMTTDISGNLLLFDLEPSLNSYVVKVSKDGYSSDRTCITQSDGIECSDSVGNPDPIKKNVSIFQGELEEVSFAIDRVSTLTVNSYNENCVILPNINFTLQGVKKISNEPSSIIKNVYPFQTNGSGTWSKNDLEWDFYDLLVNSAGYDIAGINHDLALNILPNTNTTVNVLLANHSTNSLLVTVKDSGTSTALAGASVQLIKTGYDETKTTGQGFISQTDWSGGPGQSDFTDQTKYYSDDTHIDVAGTTGQIGLKKNISSQFFSETFSNTTYKDESNTTADWNTVDEELKLPTVSSKYPINTMHYAQTTKLNSQQGKIVKATLLANEQRNGQTINYFLSADGGINFENIFLGSEYTFVNVGNDLRIRIELTTNDEDKTPEVLDMNLDYTIEYYDNSGELVSSTFNLGSAATFTTISWKPVSQPTETGTESVKFQLATSNCQNGESNPPACDSGSWDFTGPDGTSATFYQSNNADVSDSYNDHQYLRYRVILSTTDVYYSPQLDNIVIGYTLECLPPGQVYFKNLSAGTDYALNVTLAGYQDETSSVEIDGYTTKIILLTPNP